MKLPKSLGICPIVDSVIEIRFESALVPQAVFGLVYELIRETFGEFERLPLADMPDEFKAHDPNLKFKPLYKLTSKERFICQIGSNVLSVGMGEPYSGWTKFSKITYDTFDKVFNKGNIVTDVNRLGIRYTNFFNRDIFPDSKCIILIDNQPIEYKNTQLTTEISRNGFVNRLILANNAIVHGTGTGSILDVDTSKAFQPKNNFMKNFREEIEIGHNVEKEIFWSLLTEQAQNKLEPIYDNE